MRDEDMEEKAYKRFRRQTHKNKEKESKVLKDLIRDQSQRCVTFYVISLVNPILLKIFSECSFPCRLQVVANDVAELRHRPLTQADIVRQESLESMGSNTAAAASQSHALLTNISTLTQQLARLTSKVDTLTTDVRPLLDFVKKRKEKQRRSLEESEI